VETLPTLPQLSVNNNQLVDQHIRARHHPTPPNKQFSFFASAAVPLPALTQLQQQQLAAGQADPCKWSTALAGGWAAARAARMYVTEQGRLTLAFPGDAATAYRPDRGSKWC